MYRDENRMKFPNEMNLVTIKYMYIIIDYKYIFIIDEY